MGDYNFKTLRTVKAESTAREENGICLFVQQVFADNLTEIVSFFILLINIHTAQ